MWKPSASLTHLHQRAEILAKIRSFFNDRGYLEVETPILGKYGITDFYLTNMKAQFRNQTYYLQTSPEYHMKRLLAAGSGPIFQISKVFREDELGRWHNPEFSLLEWYQLGVDHRVLMEEVNSLLQTILECPASIQKTYQQVFIEICQFDPFNISVQELQPIMARYDLENVLSEEDPLDQYLFLLMSHIIEPSFAIYESPVAIYDFPPSQAALAQIKNGVAQRFEFYYKGVELANGFHELRDAKAQKQRFEQDLQQRVQYQLDTPSMDPLLLQALESGLPPCSGVALGVDRLIALGLNQDNIASILTFEFSRA